MLQSVQELIREFGLNLRELLSQFEDFMHTNLALCRDLENINHAHMLGQVTIIIDKLVHNKLTVDVEKQLSEVINYITFRYRHMLIIRYLFINCG